MSTSEQTSAGRQIPEPEPITIEEKLKMVQESLWAANKEIESLRMQLLERPSPQQQPYTQGTLVEMAKAERKSAIELQEAEQDEDYNRGREDACNYFLELLTKVGQPDELSKAGEHWKKRWEIQCEAVDVAQTSVTTLHFELSKAQARIRELEVAQKGNLARLDELNAFVKGIWEVLEIPSSLILKETANGVHLLDLIRGMKQELKQYHDLIDPNMQP